MCVATVGHRLLQGSSSMREIVPTFAQRVADPDVDFGAPLLGSALSTRFPLPLSIYLSG